MTIIFRLALALALAGAASTTLPAHDATATEAPPMAVTTIAATRGPVVETVLVDGSLVARGEGGGRRPGKGQGERQAQRVRHGRL
ncbi:MAG: hypothetical protein ACKOUS_13665, partial [Alphaproteobacteria bacterium]